jgi:ABC-type sugar transport system permease subunit
MKETVSISTQKIVKRKLSLSDADTRFASVMIAPAVIILVVLVVYPIFSGLRLSLFDYNLMSKSRPFIGFKNFIELATDSRFRLILWNTIVFTLISNTISTMIGLVTALLLNKSGKLSGVMRGLGYLPWITPGVVYVFVWSWMLSKNFSPLNGLLLSMGVIDSPIGFLGDMTSRFLGLTIPAWSVILVRVWASYPFKMTMLLAALQSIPQEHYDAARVDGANSWQQFRHIMMPALFPVLLIVYSISTIWNLSHFEVNYLLTGGGPQDYTNVITLFIYQKAFVHYRMGLSSAAGVVIFVLAGLVGLVYMKLVRKEAVR